jgi:hypothetical protein
MLCLRRLALSCEKRSDVREGVRGSQNLARFPFSVHAYSPIRSTHGARGGGLPDPLQPRHCRWEKDADNATALDAISSLENHQGRLEGLKRGNAL